MTGEHGRPEVIVEGAYEPNGPWTPFDFYAKPGKLDEAPRFICITKSPKDYWSRDFREAYMPPITREDPSFLNFLHENGYVLKERFTLKDQNIGLERKIRNLHNYVRTLDPSTFVDSLIVTHAAIVLFSYLNFNK
ncbi:unnamed protein product [Gongylonema pulchrum]|uniref:Lipase maturation factor n=1 Tax=Gongylonema pulchrum TaxID=637853 RepID=A0A183E7I7_9BILA|nr:unnamed protein product [Gongylonema pulchrum]